MRARQRTRTTARSTTRRQVVLRYAAFAVCVLAGCGNFVTVGVTAGAGAGGVGGPSPSNPPDASVRDAMSRDSGSGDDAGVISRVNLDDCRVGNAGQLDAQAIAAISSSGNASSATMRWLYPYDGTVFPAGLAAPVLMWKGPALDAVYVHLHSQRLEYRGCLKPTGDHQLQLSQKIWDSAGAVTHGKSDPFQLELGTITAGQPSGLIREQVVIAPQPLRGSVYYMTFIPNPMTNMLTSALMRVRPNQPAVLLFGGAGCTACHAVSANGTRLITYSQGFGVPFTIAADTTDAPAPIPIALPGGELTGIYPDGTLYVAPAHPNGVGPRTYLTASPLVNAGLYDSATGAAHADANIPVGATMPSFSPDGSLLAFNDYALNSGHGLAVMDFAAATTTASNYRSVFVDELSYPGWPAFLPGESALVFTRGAAADFSGMGAQIGTNAATGPKTDLSVINLTGNTPVLLAHAMGFSSLSNADTDTTYLPFGVTELHQNYYPTVVPLATGDYDWVFFDSVRHYGNQGIGRQIWGSAIDRSTDGKYTIDPSHPAFYLPGQDVMSANLRPIAALDPCAADSAACSSDAACCSGSCRANVCAPPTQPVCAPTGSLCSSDLDCCDRTQRCIDSYCFAPKN